MTDRIGTDAGMSTHFVDDNSQDNGTPVSPTTTQQYDQKSNGNVPDDILGGSQVLQSENGEQEKQEKKASRKSSKSSARPIKTSRKRLAEFNRVFNKELPESERKLIADFSCALVRDILVQGRLYLTENYCCFYSTILGWETSAIIPYMDITQISKEKTVKIIPNAISVHCNQNKYIFTSFTARDRALYIFKELWKLKLSKSNQSNGIMDRIDSDLQEPQFDIDDPTIERISNASQNSEDNDIEVVTPFPEEKGSKVYLDAEFPVPVETLFSLFWLPSSPFWTAFMNLRKTKNWHCEEWRSEGEKIIRECRCLQYIQLPMGGKDIPQTDHHVLVLSERNRIVLDAKTYIREIPYGDSFHTFNRWQFLGSSKPNTSRLRVSTLVIYEKQCWTIVKGFIDKNAYEGNCSFMTELRDELGKFVQDGKVSEAIAESSQTAESMSNAARDRSASTLSIRQSVTNPLIDPCSNSQSNFFQSESQNSASNVVTSSEHVNSLRHWVWLFFFFVGVLLYSNWSLHFRLSAIEASIGGNQSPEQDQTINPKNIQDENSLKSLTEISELLKVLVSEVQKLRSSGTIHTDL